MSIDEKVFSVIAGSKCKFSLLNLIGFLSLSQLYCILNALIKIAQRKKESRIYITQQYSLGDLLNRFDNFKPLLLITLLQGFSRFFSTTWSSASILTAPFLPLKTSHPCSLLKPLNNQMCGLIVLISK